MQLPVGWALPTRTSASTYRWWAVPTLLCALMAQAAPPTTAEAPFQFRQTDLLKAAPRSVFVAFMGNYRTPAVSQEWGGWAHRGQGGKRHDPDTIGPTGRRDIASCYYPAIGPYDMSDPHVVEYQCQLLKMAGIDGISFNLYFFDRDPWRQQSMKLYVDAMQRYGLKGIVRFEDKFYANFYGDSKAALNAIYADMDAWLKLMQPVQYRVAGRPVFMFFTYGLKPDELEAWKEKYPKEHQPLLVTFGTKSAYTSIIEGRFGWTGDQPNRLVDRPPYVIYVDPAMMRANERHDRQRAAELLDRGDISFYVAGVSPGFDDIGCWGWGDGPRKVERDEGRTYRYRWDQVLKSDLPVVLIPTWNDWAEGTTIEPAMEYGIEYLSMTRDYAARFKHVPAPAGELMAPIWIYRIRKAADNPAAIKDMLAASEAIVAGDFAKAESIAKPWAIKLGVTELAPK